MTRACSFCLSRYYKLLYGLYLLLLLWPQGVRAQSNGWVWVNPQPQGNMLHHGFAVNDSTVFIVGKFGTVMKSTDGGATWTVQHHAGGTQRDLVGVAFSDAQQGVAVTEWGKLLHTEDGGRTWTLQERDEEELYDHIVYLGAHSFLILVRLNRTPIENAVLLSEDGGLTWTRFLTGESRFFSVASPGDGTAVASAPPGPLFRTIDSGRTWSPLAFDTSLILPYVVFADANTGYAFGTSTSRTVVRTDDGGVTWTALDQPVSSSNSSIRSVNCLTPNACLVLSESSLYQTTDGAESWEATEKTSLSHKHVMAVNDTTALVMGGFPVRNLAEATLLRSTDAGATWQDGVQDQTTVPLAELHSLYFFDGERGVVAGRGITRTEDGGRTWTAASIQGADDFPPMYYDVCFADTARGIAVGSGIIRTEDGGRTWTPGEVDVDVFDAVACLNPLKAVAVRNKTVAITEDGGRSWRTTEVDAKNDLLDLDFYDDHLGLAVGYAGTLLWTSDGGNTWVPDELPSLGQTTTSHSVAFLDAQTILVTAGDFIFRSEDGGATWDSQRLSPGTQINDLHFLNEHVGMAVGENPFDDRIYYTEDGGQTWQAQLRPSDTPLNAVFLAHPDTAYAVGKQGHIIKTVTGGLNIPTSTEQPAPLHPLQVESYPNPFHKATTIRAVLEEPGRVTIQIFDPLGRRVRRLTTDHHRSGLFEWQWDGRDGSGRHVASGLYFCEIITGDARAVQPVMRLR